MSRIRRLIAGMLLLGTTASVWASSCFVTAPSKCFTGTGGANLSYTRTCILTVTRLFNATDGFVNKCDVTSSGQVDCKSVTQPCTHMRNEQDCFYNWVTSWPTINNYPAMVADGPAC